jgi:hypothetical protein
MGELLAAGRRRSLPCGAQPVVDTLICFEQAEKSGVHVNLLFKTGWSSEDPRIKDLAFAWATRASDRPMRSDITSDARQRGPGRTQFMGSEERSVKGAARRLSVPALRSANLQIAGVSACRVVKSALNSGGRILKKTTASPLNLSEAHQSLEGAARAPLTISLQDIVMSDRIECARCFGSDQRHQIAIR